MGLLTLSLDWNCVIALENDEKAAASVRALVEAHRSGKADVALLATSASENLRDHTFPGSYALFEARVREAGLSDLPVLNTPAVWGLVFWDRCYWVDGDEYLQVKSSIWGTLFPTIPDSPPISEEDLHAPSSRKWRNAWCDVHNLIAHIHGRRDVFVTTNTSDFQRHAERLRGLGVGEVLEPHEAIGLI